jgi:type I restriction enzyme S subunit
LNYFLDEIVPLPPKQTQRKIADYLDEKTEIIDKIIKRKKKLIELLKIKRQTMIDEAFLKIDSKNIKIEKLKFVSKIGASNVDKKSNEEEGKVFLCNYTDVYNNEFIDSNFNFMEATAKKEQIKKFALRKSDVLITKDSESWDDIAIPALVKEDLKDVVCGYHLAHIRTNNNKVLGGYLFRLLQSKKINSQFCVLANGITRFGLSVGSIKNMEINYPDLDKQQEIIEYLDKKTEDIDKTIKKINQSINLLTEYKSSLISHVVTGKVKV